MTSLNSFGSILTFAIELETRIRDYYHVGSRQHPRRRRR